MTQPIVQETPILPITIVLGPALAMLAARPNAEAQIRRDTERVVATLLETLGIPGCPQVETAIQRVEEPSPQTSLFRLIVGGQPCRFSEDIVLQAYSSVEGRPLLGLEELNALPEWLGADTLAEDDASTRRGIELLTLICRQALADQAGLLLTRKQAEHYCADLALAHIPSTEHVRAMLCQVLDLGISIADRDTVRGVLSEEPDGDYGLEERAEKLIAALRPTAIEVRLEPAYLRQITLDNVDGGTDKFPFMRDGLFVELGLTLPDIHFVPDTTLKPGAFTFTINHLPTLPLIGLPPETLLVNDTADRLHLMNITGTPTVNPASMHPSSLVEHGNKELLERSGLTTWDQVGYLILHLTAVLRRAGYRLVDRRFADSLLQQFGKAFPDLEQTTRAHVSLEALTKVLRALIAEELSIRNLRRILERLIEYEACTDDAYREIDRVAYVRMALADYVAHKYAKGTGTLVVDLLDPEIEQALKR